MLVVARSHNGRRSSKLILTCPRTQLSSATNIMMDFIPFAFISTWGKQATSAVAKIYRTLKIIAI